jgi:hypothetical protein
LERIEKGSIEEIYKVILVAGLKELKELGHTD